MSTLKRCRQLQRDLATRKSHVLKAVDEDNDLTFEENLPPPRPENVSFASVSTAVEDKPDEQMGNEDQYRAVRDTTLFIDRSIKRIVREVRSQLQARPHAQTFQTRLSAIHDVWRISKMVVGLDGEDGRLVRETFMMDGNPLSNALLKLASSFTGSERRRVLGAVDEDGVTFRAKMDELTIFCLEEHGCVVMPDLEETYAILVGARRTQTSYNGKGFDSESESEGSD
ncbi:hypothetical protein IWX90DRAFT_418508 [Phyllosticta citrichinensis]|uniref:Uncharacterized protein n=1 Tax=Phyllosticta citrichinensis TaxID=1130410 RepID=A0ABR1XGY9_9PEZI